MHYKKRKLHKLHSIPIGLCNKVNHNRLYLVSYSIPLSCMVVLLLGGIVAVNPSLPLKSSAVTIQDEWVVKDSDESNKNVEVDGVDNTSGDGIMPLLSDDDWYDSDNLPIPACSGTTESTVTIVLGDTSQTIQSVQGGDTVYGGYRIALGGCNLKDYALSLQADSENLTPPSGSGSTSIVRGAGNKTGNEMMANTWGYNVADYNTADSNYGGLTYSSLSATPTVIASGTPSGNIDVYKKLVFAAKFAEDAAPGTYTGHITLSAVATEITQLWSDGTDSGIRNMQNISAGFCKSSLPEGVTIKLRDSRDQQEYTIVKLKDGQCWMQQNLRLKLTKNTKIEGSMTDGTAYSWTVPNQDSATTQAYSTSGTWTSDNTVVMSRAGNGTNGAYYTWCAATAGTCPSSGVASASICPKGWHLPTGNTNGEFYNLFGANGANLGTDYQKRFDNIKASPYMFPAAGYVNYNGSLHYEGSDGYYWSSTASSGTSAYYLAFNSSGFDPGTHSSNRYYGGSVRCVANY